MKKCICLQCIRATDARNVKCKHKKNGRFRQFAMDVIFLAS